MDRHGEAIDWPKVAIIILNWNSWRDTIDCLKSLQHISYPNYEIIIVDNGSTDDSAVKIEAWTQYQISFHNVKLKPHVENPRCEVNAEVSAFSWDIVIANPKLVFIAAKENLGFSEGNNLGIEYALFGPYPAGFVFLLNNDARPEPTCITACVEAAQKEDAGVVGAVVKSEKGDEVLFAGSRFPRELFMADRMPLLRNSSEYLRVDGVQGCAMLIRRDLLIRRKKEYGYFLDPKLFIYCEETEFCIRAKEWGYKVLLAKNAVVYHKVALSSGEGSSPLSYYYLTRNRILLARNLLPWWLRLLFHAWYVPSRLIRALQRRIEGRSSTSATILEGLVDGYRGVTGKWGKHID